MTWKEIEADEVKAGDYIDVNGTHTPIVEANQFRVSYEAAGMVSSIDVQVAVILGVRFAREIEDHPHGLIPNERGTVIRVGKCVYENHKGVWRQIGVSGFFSHQTIQERADLHGYTVLWPRPDREVTEEMVERAAREVWKVFFHRYGKDANDEWAQRSPSIRDYHKSQALRILEAALGGEQE